MGRVLALPFRKTDAEICTVSAPLTHRKGTVQEHCVDFLLPEGTPIYPVDSGIPILCQDGNTKYCFDRMRARESTNVVVLLHNNKQVTVYAHLKEVYVKVGRKLDVENPLGTSGMTGFASYPHLHFGLNEYDPSGAAGLLGKSIPVQFAETLPMPISWIEAVKRSGVPLKIILELEQALGGNPSSSTSIDKHLFAIDKIIENYKI